MDQQVVNWIIAAAGALAGWLFKILWDAIQDLKQDMRQIERDLPELYVRKDDWRESLHSIK